MKANYSFSDEQKLSECHQEPALQDPGEQLFTWKERTLDGNVDQHKEWREG